MKSLFIKPDLQLYFDAMPGIGIWLKSQYNHAKTNEELFGLVHKWFNEADTTANEVKREWLNIAAENLYSILTNKSFKSKITI